MAVGPIHLPLVPANQSENKGTKTTEGQTPTINPKSPDDFEQLGASGGVTTDRLQRNHTSLSPLLSAPWVPALPLCGPTQGLTSSPCT